MTDWLVLRISSVREASPADAPPTATLGLTALVRVAVLACLAALAGPLPAGAADVFADVETGLVWASRNDVAIPGTSGTRLSLVNDLDADAAPYARTRVGATFGRRHDVFVTWAPVRLEASGVLERDVRFRGVNFAAGSLVHARYVFDSYRATYRYRLLRSERLDLYVGGTAFVRDASISLQGASFAEKTNVGFVPLLSFRVAWRFAPRLSLVVDGDALAAPQGRAEDVLVTVDAELRPGVVVRAGYRMIEGGVDNDSTYNFALLNHLGLGLSVRL